MRSVVLLCYIDCDQNHKFALRNRMLAYLFGNLLTCTHSHTRFTHFYAQSSHYVTGIRLYLGDLSVQ